MPDAAYAIRQKVEASLLAYITSRRADGDALTGTDLILRQAVTTRKFPRAVLECPRSPELDNILGLYQVELNVYVGTQAQEADAAAKHAARTGLIAEWLADIPAIFTACNKPVDPAPDNRTVKGLIIYDLIDPQEEGEQTGEHWIDRLTYTVVAQLQDE